MSTSDIDRILVIKLRAVGDVVLSTVVLRNLREAFPHARIDFLTEPPGASVLVGNPWIDGCMVFDRRTVSGLGLVRMVRNRRYDLVVDLFGNPRTALVTRLSGARVRVGYRFRGRTYAYNVVTEPRGGTVHNTQFNLDALDRLGVPIVDRALAILPRREDEDAAARLWEELLPGSPRVIALNTGGGWPVKRWPLDHFAALGNRLAAAYGATILLPWGPGEEPEVIALQKAMRVKVVIPPATSLLELAALLRRCWLMVSNDSGPMHIAAAMGVPVVGIFGPTLPALQGPYGSKAVTVRNESLPCLGCNQTTCPIGNPCMLELSVADVERKVQELVRTLRLQ